MNNPNIKLVVSDIDGTILNDQHKVDEDLKDNIQLLNKEKIPFVLASARSPFGVFPLAEELALGTNPIACYNGALVLEGTRNNYKTIIEHMLNKEEVKVIIYVIKSEFPKVSISLYSGTQWIVDKLDKWVEIEADITKDSPKVQNLQLFLLENQAPIHKLLLVEEPKVIQELHKYLQKLHLKDSSFYLSKDNYLEVTSKKVSKERALIEIANYYDVPLSKAMAIGDNFNDIPMLTLAGLGIVMSNAPQEAKKSADVETRSNNENGVSQAIQNYILSSLK
ncbi:HAD family phosphatase [Clostridium sp. D2Q-14]|uniref:Cof-type HAD-IIB family hydrolase n=1 Tax=Anaeromonas gelatinilytica TaxID=2683194 RepID=UPI00193B2639|nr:Cof-type HAD-IIB family hydrolase [Anaeromonas gelatinilytica]MBS4536645.1 HAD family phosphatase [Anaeromonas gelatinilytica]